MPPKAKADAKAAAAEKSAEKAALAALGITPALKKMMLLDALACVTCGGTTLGPAVCCCKQSNKPPAGFDATDALLAAAKARVALEKEAARLVNAAQQSNVANQRLKAKEERVAAESDFSVIHQQGTGDDLLIVAEFPQGAKLGFSVEKNAVTQVTAGTDAAAQGVKRGWVIEEINGEPVEASKAAVLRAATVAMKSATGPLKVGFRAPMRDDVHCCSECQKFVQEEAFGAGQLSLHGPGKQTCVNCEEFAEMGGGDW
uniref:PDZ domain-containing protein n=1 Tax=Mantoniella antarctica TaxID=81844 RepID=A0A7S0XGI3_9CHLO|mmetsp:Transcript_5073/g.12633  ORF Transcript_5073/g.12633 Transcript_5073/m.12633 type:complete len:258 (+) Transcript_5073:50-823(+)